jgi:hypothetical protein
MIAGPSIAALVLAAVGRALPTVRRIDQHPHPDKEILMTQIATNPGADVGPVARTSRVRPWIAVGSAIAVFALGLLGVLPFMLVLPVIGVVLALGAPTDHVIHARSIARRPRHAVLGVVLVATLAVVILQPELSLPLVTMFGLDGSGLAVTVLAVVAVALPLARGCQRFCVSA